MSSNPHQPPFLRQQQHDWQPFPSPTATPNSEKFASLQTSPVTAEHNVLLSEADYLWNSLQSPTSQPSNFDMAMSAHEPPVGPSPDIDRRRTLSFDRPYVHADSTSFPQPDQFHQTTSFVQQYDPSPPAVEEDISFQIHTPPPTRDNSSRRKFLKPKSRTDAQSAPRQPIAATTLDPLFLSDPVPAVHYTHVPEAFLPTTQQSPEHFRPQQLFSQFHPSSAPTWHPSFEPPNPFDHDPFMAQAQAQAVQQTSQQWPIPSSGQAARALAQKAPAVDLTPTFVSLPSQRQPSPTKSNSAARARPSRSNISPTRLLVQTRPSLNPPPSSGVDPSRLVQPRPTSLARSQSFTAGTTIARPSGPYEHYHAEARKERERVQAKLRADGPSPLKRPRVSRGLVVDANGHASVVTLP